MFHRSSSCIENIGALADYRWQHWL